jgi:hypothetical protein
VPDAAGDGISLQPEREHRPAAAHECDPRSAAKTLGRGYCDDADLSRARDVRAPARGQIEIGHLDEPQGPAANRLLPQRQLRRFFGRHHANRDRSIVPYDAVRVVHGTLDVGAAHLSREIDRGRITAHVKAHGAVLEQPIERRRKHMLASVLLHVIESAHPVDIAAHRRTVDERRTQHVDDVVVLVDGLDDFDIAEATGVERLAAGRRIERGAIEMHCGTAVALENASHHRVEGAALGFLVVEPLGHRCSRGSGTPTSAKPAARSTQLSHRPHGPVDVGS